MRQRKDNNRIVMQSLVMVMQVSINMIVPIAMLTALGIWLDKRFGTSYITIILFVVGAIAGAQNVYRMVRRVYRDDEQDKEHGFSGEDNGSNKKGQ